MSAFLAMPAGTAPVARLVCVPYAGGGAAAFGAWRLPDVEVLAFRPPGKESRWREAPLHTIAAMADDLAAAVTPVARALPLALYGHSMGALVAYEAARRLTRGGVNPLLLAVGGSRAPFLPRHEAPLHVLGDAELVAGIEKEFGAFPPEVKNDPEMMQMILPGIRADFEAVETYAHREGERLACPILVLAGTEEDFDDAELAGWGEVTAGPVRLQRIAGGHFFIRTAPDDVLRLLHEAVR